MPHNPTRVCPWWLIHTFDNPLRKLVQKPEAILRGLVTPGDKCLDLGCGYGYFTIPMAMLAGPSGSVTAVDVQPEMLAGVKRRAEKTGMASRIRLHLADASGLQLDGPYDFVLAFWMMHEVPDQEATIRALADNLKPGGRLLLVEPKMHVKEHAFAQTVAIAVRAGLSKSTEPGIFISRATLLTR